MAWCVELMVAKYKGFCRGWQVAGRRVFCYQGDGAAGGLAAFLRRAKSITAST